MELENRSCPLEPDYDWPGPPEILAVSRDEVHVWKVQLNQTGRNLRYFEQILAPDELAKARRFHFDRDRRRFIAARAQLRIILSRYAKADPSTIEFSYGRRGKPAFATPLNPGAIKFNLSHSGELALIGVALERDIGVDLEEVHRLEDAERIAQRFFSAREYTVLRALPEAEKLEAFFRCWTRKEAYVKATGDGLARATGSFDVTFVCGEPARLLSVDGMSKEASRWSLAGLGPAPGFVGALAVEGHGWSMIRWQCFK